jgi:hypothetical protein
MTDVLVVGAGRLVLLVRFALRTLVRELRW